MFELGLYSPVYSHCTVPPVYRSDSTQMVCTTPADRAVQLRWDVMQPRFLASACRPQG
jgi:hypothetical protein